MLVTPELKQKLLERGVSSHHVAPFGLPDHTIVEPPCSLKWMVADWQLELSAFSYAVNGYYFGASIGRYTSIGENVQIGRGSHPVAWATTSPILYQPHRFVVDFDIPEAAQFTPSAPYIAPRQTQIGHDVYIGHGAFVMQGVTIGHGAVIGAMSVVTKDVAPYAVVGGSPATIRRMRFPDPLIERFLRVAWWNHAFWDLAGAEVAEPERFLNRVEDLQARGLRPYRPERIDVLALSRT